MKIKENQIVGELVAQDYRAAQVFQSFGIDFCCKGNKTIHEACQDKNINPLSLIENLEQATSMQENKSIDYQSWPIDLLTDYIEKKHHRFVEAKILEIKPYLDKICNVHAAKHPELIEIKEHFNAAAGELTQHMKKEELILFPFIRKLMKAKLNGIKTSEAHFGTVKNPIQMMMQEHEMEGDRFATIAHLSNSYTPPEDACNTYKVTFSLLKEFENDLHLHIHLENNILFPKAIELEKQLTQL